MRKPTYGLELQLAYRFEEPKLTTGQILLRQLDRCRVEEAKVLQVDDIYNLNVGGELKAALHLPVLDEEAVDARALKYATDEGELVAIGVVIKLRSKAPGRTFEEDADEQDDEGETGDNLPGTAESLGRIKEDDE